MTLVAPLAVTAVDLLQSTNATTLETTATALPGNLAGGFTMVLDPTEDWYYLDTDTITANRPLVGGSFHLQGVPATEIFTLQVGAGGYWLRDTYANDGTPLRIQGNFPLGTYTYEGTVRDAAGFTAAVTIKMTLVAPLAVTEVDLLQSTNPTTLETTATALPGNLAGGFTMVLDPTEDWYYLDTDTITANRPLVGGSFHLQGVPADRDLHAASGCGRLLVARHVRE